MASCQAASLLQCTRCYQKLDFESKTLPCLHSFCRLCIDRTFEGHTNMNDQCPECREPIELDQSSLSPFLAKCLRRLRLESNDLKCDLCLEDGSEFIPTNLCVDCQKLFCDNCTRIHKKLIKGHKIRGFDQMGRGEVISAMEADNCPVHHKELNSYCESCNKCFCDTCYRSHCLDSPNCSSQPLSMREEASRLKAQGPTIAKEMDDIAKSLEDMIVRTKKSTAELTADCDSKCREMWGNLEEMIEKAKQRTDRICDDIRKMTSKMVEKWRRLINENERILKKLEVWRLNLHHLVSESHQDTDVVCGLRMLKSKVSSEHEKSIGPEEKCQLKVTYFDWWLQTLEQLKTQNIGSVSLLKETPNIGWVFETEYLSGAEKIIFSKEWNLLESNMHIQSIYVSKEDRHVFLCCFYDKSIMEFTKEGEFVHKCFLKDGTKELIPWDVCSISTDILVAIAGRWWGNKKLVFLRRRKNPPFIKINKIVDTENIFLSMFLMNEMIFISDNSLRVYSFTKEGQQMKSIKDKETGGKYWSRIRNNPRTGNFWMTKKENESELFCYNLSGEKIQSVKNEENIADFCIDEFGNSYFCNHSGIFSFNPEKVLYRFEKVSERHPRMFVIKNEIFVSLRIEGKDLIKILKIFY